LFDQAASERLFSALSYAVFAAPAVVVLAWMVGHVIAWGVKRDRRLFARSPSPALARVFLFCLVLPLVFVPMRYLADRIEGPKILLWHWLLVPGSMAVLALWLIARWRRQRDWRSRL
jgi:hypothetical protein